MELGIGSYAFRWAVGTATFSPPEPLTLEGMIQEAARLGCTLLQIADNAELEAADAGELRRLRTIASERGVRLQNGLSGVTEDGLKRHLEIAVVLESDVVRLVLHDGGGHSEDAVAVLRAVAPLYESAGVTVGIENHFLTTSPEMVRIVQAVDSRSVGVILDVGNSIVCGEWPELTIDLLAPLAVGLHLKDYDIVPDADGVGGHLVGRPLGDGRTDIDAVLAALPSASDSFGVILEQWSPRGEDDVETLEIEREWRERSVAAARRYAPLVG